MNLRSVVPNKVSTPAKLFLVMMILNGFGNGIQNVVMQLYLVSLGFDSVALGTLSMMNFIGAALFTIPVGIIADRYGKVKIMLFGFSMLGLEIVLLLTTKSIEMLMLAFLFVGVANAAGSLFVPLYASFFDREDMDRAFGLYSFLNILALSLGSLSGFVPSILVANYGFNLQSAYWNTLAVGAIFLLAMLPLFIMVFRSFTEPTKKEGEAESKFILRSRWVVFKFCLINIIHSIGFGIFFNLLPYYVNKKFGTESADLGTLYFISNFIQAGANISAVKVTKMMGTLKAIVVSLTLSTPFYLLIPLTSSFTWFSVFYIVRIALVNLSLPLIPSLFMKLLDKKERATANSITTTASMGGNIIAPKLGGQLIKQVSLDFPAYLGAGLYAIYAAFCYFLLKNEAEKDVKL